MKKKRIIKNLINENRYIRRKLLDYELKSLKLEYDIFDCRVIVNVCLVLLGALFIMFLLALSGVI